MRGRSSLHSLQHTVQHLHLLLPLLSCNNCTFTRNTHFQRASHQYYYAHAHQRIAQLCARMSINDATFLIVMNTYMYIHVCTYVHHENRSLIQSLTLMRSAIMIFIFFSPPPGSHSILKISEKEQIKLVWPNDEFSGKCYSNSKIATCLGIYSYCGIKKELLHCSTWWVISGELV